MAPPLGDLRTNRSLGRRVEALAAPTQVDPEDVRARLEFVRRMTQAVLELVASVQAEIAEAFEKESARGGKLGREPDSRADRLEALRALLGEAPRAALLEASERPATHPPLSQVLPARLEPERDPSPAGPREPLRADRRAPVPVAAPPKFALASSVEIEMAHSSARLEDLRAAAALASAAFEARSTAIDLKEAEQPHPVEQSPDSGEASGPLKEPS